MHFYFMEEISLGQSNKKGYSMSWPIKILIYTVILTIIFSLLASEILSGTGYIISFLVLLMFIALGVVFDIIGIATTTVDEKPFYSMAAKKVKGSSEAVSLIKNAEKVSSICNDVVGDIAGIISGTTTATIVTRLVRDFSVDEIVFSLILSAVVSGLTVGTKAIGKQIGMKHNVKIVHACGKIVSVFKFKKKKV